MVVMSVEQFAVLDNERRISTALLEAQGQVESGVGALDFYTISKSLRAKLVSNIDANA